jgi:hypothetical protein
MFFRIGSDEISNLVMENTRILSAVLTAMLNHRFDPGLQQYGCCVVSNLAVAGEDVRRKLKKNGVVDVKLSFSTCMTLAICLILFANYSLLDM